MKILVTGGTGLLSGPVVSHLLDQGAEVSVFHRTPGGVANSVTELIGDRADHPAFVDIVRQHGPWDCLIDMIAGTPGDASSVIEAARGLIPHVIMCSTTTVYGRPFARVPVVEEGALLEPPSPYGENKLACESRLREAEAAGGPAVTIIRPAHIYNEGSRLLHSLGNRSSHLDRIRKDRPIIVHDDGLGRWSSLWVDDAAAAFTAAASAPAAKGKTYHLAGSEAYTWNTYHGWLAAALEVALPELRHVPVEKLAEVLPDRTMQLQRTLRYPGVYDCSAAERDLGFRPAMAPAEGFTRNVRYLRDNDLIEPWQEDEEYERTVQALHSI